jgi:hypothetical protein
VPQLTTALAHFAVRSKDPVHRARRAQVLTFIEQHGPHLPRSSVREAIRIQGLEDLTALSQNERPWRRGPRLARPLHRRLTAAVERGTRISGSLTKGGSQGGLGAWL